MTHPDTINAVSSRKCDRPPRPTTERGNCSCSRHNAHLLDLNDWRADPNCPRHGDRATWNGGDPTLDIDTSYTREEHH